MGSRFKTRCAYIAGFLDGDGSLMLQIKKRKDGKSKFRFMTTICFYQDGRHEAELSWIRNQLNIGYLSRRNDGMSELRINGYRQVKGVLEKLFPYIRFKRVQAQTLLRACTILNQGTLKSLSDSHFKKLVECIMIIQQANYSTRRKRTQKELYSVLGLTP